MIYLPTILNNDKIKSTARLKMPASYFLEEYIMKKIAILRCLITSASCAGAGCLRALYEKDKPLRSLLPEDKQAQLRC